ncbi:MAG TPA: DUF4112 domain-containing protein [Burkholderiales bacterium]|nr:DUF4112 domain-containing protein [Burkholderiales bacterium]
MKPPADRVLEGEVLPPESETERELRQRLNFLAWLLDSSIPIPGTRLTIGLDALIGLFPFIGDLLGVVASSYILAEANRMGVGRTILARMAFNVAIEGVIGIVPIAGDVFDAAWKANQKNVRLLNAWAERPHQTRRASGLFLAVLTVALIGFFAACGYLTYLLFRWMLG